MIHDIKYPHGNFRIHHDAEKTIWVEKLAGGRLGRRSTNTHSSWTSYNDPTDPNCDVTGMMFFREIILKWLLNNLTKLEPGSIETAEQELRLQTRGCDKQTTSRKNDRKISKVTTGISLKEAIFRQSIGRIIPIGLPQYEQSIAIRQFPLRITLAMNDQFVAVSVFLSHSNSIGVY